MAPEPTPENSNENGLPTLAGIPIKVEMSE
jgi:hypothetical protein